MPHCCHNVQTNQGPLHEHYTREHKEIVKTEWCICFHADQETVGTMHIQYLQCTTVC